MTKAPELDLSTAHEFFSVHCFNGAWSLMDRADRTEDDNERLVGLAHASYWHWAERADCTKKNLAIAYWLLSRVYALVGRAQPALYYASLSLKAGKAARVSPYLLGSAHEAMARAAHLAGDDATFSAESRKAREIAQALEKVEERKMLLADIDSIGARSA